MSNPIMSLVISVLSPIVTFLDSLAYLGVNSHIIKLDAMVRFVM